MQTLTQLADAAIDAVKSKDIERLLDAVTALIVGVRATEQSGESMTDLAAEVIKNGEGFIIAWSKPIAAGMRLYTRPQSAPAVPDEALSQLDAIIADLQGGFVRCERCGDQEDTKDLDVVPQLHELRALLAAAPQPKEGGE
uniref:hypothetical protein n=1 Tax=Chromobacterium amazonense TaxID=1382803 RepID=UPI003F7AAE4A